MIRSIHLQLFVSLVALVTVTLLWVVPAQAQFNEQINYQGRLLDSTGSAVTDGTYAMEFNLYTVATSGSAIWTETLSGVNEVTVTDGLFSVMLGSTSALTSVDFNQTLYLGVTIEADSEMAPRKILGAVPAAFVAKEADNASTVGGVASTSLVRNDAAGTTTASSTATILSVVQNGLGKIASFFSGVTEVFTILNNGNVGIGTTTPSSRLAVAGSAVIGGNLTATGTLSVGTLNGLLLGTNGVVSAVATSTLGLGNGTFLGLSDTPNSYTANRLLFTNTAGNALTDSSALTFSGSLLSITGSTTASAGYYIGTTSAIIASTTLNSFYFAGAPGTTTETGNYNYAIGSGALANIGTFISNNNIAIGQETLKGSSTATMTGQNNIALGTKALWKNTTGSWNTALGEQTLWSNTSGGYNIAMGYYALLSNTSGNYNVAIGQTVMDDNTTGSSNTAVGDSAMYRNTTGSENTVFGTGALFNNNGTGTIAIGAWTADNAVSVDRGIFIGYNIDAASTTQDDVLNIGNLIFGNNVDGTGTTLSSGNIGIGTSSPSSKLTVAGAGYFGGNLTATGTLTISGTSTLATTTIASSTITTLNLLNALAVTSGGTGLSSYSTGDLIYASGANMLANRTIGSTGNVLSVVGGVPTWVATSTLGITGATTFLALTDTPSSYTANRIMFTNSGATALTDSASLTFDGTRLSVPNLIVTSTSTFTGTSTFTTGALATYFGSAAADIADAGVLRLGNNELIAWEASPAGTDVSLSVNASEQMLFQGATSSGYVFDNGISLGSALASATTSLNRHLSLWGSVYGFSVTVNSLNYNVAGVGAHNFYRGGALDMSLTGGSLGIGTANPQQRLDVGNGLITGGTNSGTRRNTLNLSGSASIPAVDFTFPGSGYFRVAEVGVLGTNDVFFQALPATTAGYGYLEAWDSAGMVLGTGNNAAPVIFRPNRTERMRVTAGGNVGIGTTSPLTRLELAGSGTLDQVLRLSNTDTTLSSAQQIGGVEFVSTDANDTAGVVAKVAAYSLGTTGSFGNLGFYTGSISSQLSEKMTILANGNVGIGSTSPSSLLTVAGTTTLATTTVTDVTLSGAFRDVTSSAGTLGQVLQSTGTSTRWVATSTLGISGGGTFLSLTDTPSSFTANRIMFTNSGATALTDSASLTFDGSQLATLNLAVTGTSTFTGTTTMASTSISGTLQMGTTSVSSRFNLDVNNFSAAGTAGLNRFYTSTNAASGTVQFGELGYFKNSASATTTIVSSLFRVEDSTTFGNTVRGLEVQANRGTNTQGENTALSGFARTFGVRGFSSGDAGARFEPAGGYFETGGTTQGNAIRGYSSSITSANLLALFQDTSTFSGTGLNIDLGNGTGSFTGKFLDLKVAGASRFNVASTGTLVTQGDISIVTTNTDPAANNVVGMYFGANGFASINRTGNVAMNLGRSNDGAVLQFYSAGAVQGSVSIAGATVSYNAFTGSHFGLMPRDAATSTYEKGTLLELTGENEYYNDDATSEIVYGMQKTTTENSSRVIGTYLASLEPSQPQSTANPTLVMAVGNGHMWVADQGEDIVAGDYLISSNIAGHAEKDTSTSSVSYIIARASEDINWNNITTEIDGVKHTLITVFFENFTRPNVDFALVASSTIGLADVPEDSFTDSFLTGLFAKVAQWVGDAQNGIGSMYANVFNAGERICVDGECLTADDIRDLKNALQGGGSSNPPSSPGGDGGGGSTEGDTGGGETVDDGSAAGGEAGTGGDGVADGNTGATDGTTDGGAGTSSGDSGGTDSGGADVGSSDGGA